MTDSYRDDEYIFDDNWQITNIVNNANKSVTYITHKDEINNISQSNRVFIYSNTNVYICTNGYELIKNINKEFENIKNHTNTEYICVWLGFNELNEREEISNIFDKWCKIFENNFQDKLEYNYIKAIKTLSKTSSNLQHNQYYYLTDIRKYCNGLMMPQFLAFVTRLKYMMLCIKANTDFHDNEMNMIYIGLYCALFYHFYSIKFKNKFYENALQPGNFNDIKSYLITNPIYLNHID